MEAWITARFGGGVMPGNELLSGAREKGGTREKTDHKVEMTRKIEHAAG